MNELKSLTREKLMEASIKDVLHHNDFRMADGGCERWRVSGKAKTWVMRPKEFRVPIKYGVYESSAITEANVGDFHLESECPYLQFKEIGHGEKFEFRGAIQYPYVKKEPWVKVSERRYVAAEMWDGERVKPCAAILKVGSINAWCRREDK